MLTVILWKWKKIGTWSTCYFPEHVNAAARMIRANLHIPHRIVCVTDDPAGITECETMPLWDAAPVRVEENKPNCYKRLRLFAPEAAELFGPRFVSFDLDCLIMPGPDGRGITPLFEGGEDFKIVNGFRNGRGCCPYNGSMWMMDAGARPEVWSDFDPMLSPKLAAANKMPNGNNYFGSDQAWIAHKLQNEKTWGPADGVLSYVRDMHLGDEDVPGKCRVMFFAGNLKPWSNNMKRTFPCIWKAYKPYLQPV